MGPAETSGQGLGGRFFSMAESLLACYHMPTRLKMSKAKQPKKETPSFEQALARLEEVVAELESGETPLENAIALVEEGQTLYRLCHEQLTLAEGKVEKLVERLGGGVQTEPLELNQGRPSSSEEE